VGTMSRMPYPWLVSSSLSKNRELFVRKTGLILTGTG
jgi:hypothetical protein